MAILTTLGVLFKETGITMLFTCAALDILYNTNVFPGSSKLQDWREIPWRRILVLCLTAVVYIVFRFLMGAPTFQLEDNPFALIEDRIFRVSPQSSISPIRFLSKFSFPDLKSSLPTFDKRVAADLSQLA